MTISDLMILGASLGAVRGVFTDIGPWWQGLIGGITLGAFIGLTLGLSLLALQVIRLLARQILNPEQK